MFLLFQKFQKFIIHVNKVYTFFRVIPKYLSERQKAAIDALFPVKHSISYTNSSKYQSTFSVIRFLSIAISALLNNFLRPGTPLKGFLTHSQRIYLFLSYSQNIYSHIMYWQYQQ